MVELIDTMHYKAPDTLKGKILSAWCSADLNIVPAGRFPTQEDMKPANRRRLSPQYMCTWKKQICEQEPISFLLGPDCCNSGCTNLKTDMFNCGTCGGICFYGSICCSGVCTDIFSNNEHCGSCSNNCPSGEVCQYGICGYT